MSRPAKLNEVPRAPFSLQSRGQPMLASEARAALGDKWFVASGKDHREDATIDLFPCPICQSPVEWAWTSKTSAIPGKLDSYVYARCLAHPAEHRWGFRKPSPVRTVSNNPIPLTEEVERTAPMYIGKPPQPTFNPFDGFEAWISARIVDALKPVEARLAEQIKEGLRSLQTRPADRCW